MKVPSSFSSIHCLDSSLADPTRAAVSVVQGSTRRFTLSVVDDLGSPITSGSYTWKVSRRASDQDYVITKTVAVGVPFIFRPEDTAALASGFYSFEVTYKLGGVVRQAVKPSPYYVGQKVIEFRATYPTTAQPSFVPEVTVSLTGVFENGEPTSPGVPYNARTSIRLNPADTLIQITNVTPIGSTGAIARAELLVGERFNVRLNPRLAGTARTGRRYLGVRYTVTGSNATAGAIFADFGVGVQDGLKFYSSGYSIL